MTVDASPKTVVVLGANGANGANGATGRLLVHQALQGGHRVRAVTRHPEQLTQPDSQPDQHDGQHGARLDVVRADVTDAAAVSDVVAGSDAVVSALGVPYSRQPITLYSRSAENVVAALRRHGVRRLVAVSSSAVEPDAARQGRFVMDHLVAPLIHRLGRTLYADMRAMEAVVRSSELDWTLVRPPALAPADGVGAYRTSDTFIRGQYATRPDLAAFMLAEVAQPTYVRQTAWIVSPEARSSLLRTIWHDGLGR